LEYPMDAFCRPAWESPHVLLRVENNYRKIAFSSIASCVFVSSNTS
jgi:hypothetical protein